MAPDVHPLPDLPGAGAFAADGPVEATAADPMLVDCDHCSVRGAGCPDCVVTFLLGGPPADVELGPDERRALDVLASAGMVPPLRMVKGLDSPAGDDAAP